MKQDYYEQLGVSRDATDDQIKRAYRNLAKQYHPDANPGDKSAEEKFKEVSEAYSVLSDSNKRQQYNQFGHSAFESGGGGGFHGGMDPNDILRSVFGGGSMDFGDFFGGGRQRPRTRRGADLQRQLNIKFEEAVFGATKDISIQTFTACATCSGSGAKPGTYPETCRKCNGTGSERVTRQSFMGIMTQIVACSECRGEGRIIKDPCLDCRGEGRVRTTQNIEVTIPKGIDHGQSIKLSGKGEMGEKGTPAGDLYITIAVASHKVFKRDGMNLYLEIPITFVQAALGDEIMIPTLADTEERYNVKAGTQPGTFITLRGKGVPNVHRPTVVGDLVVKLNVTVPTSMNEKQKDALKAFNEAMGDDYKNHKKKWYEKIKNVFA